MIMEYRPDILFLCETRGPSKYADWILSRFYFTNFAIIEARGFAGGCGVFGMLVL